MHDARKTAHCVRCQLLFNSEFVLNITALVHRNCKVINLCCLCYTSGRKCIFTHVPHSDDQLCAEEETSLLTISTNYTAAELNS